MTYELELLLWIIGLPIAGVVALALFTSICIWIYFLRNLYKAFTK